MQYQRLFPQLIDIVPLLTAIYPACATDLRRTCHYQQLRLPNPPTSEQTVSPDRSQIALADQNIPRMIPYRVGIVDHRRALRTSVISSALARHQRNQPPEVENIRGVLDRDQVWFLLKTLCETLGYCLPLREQERILSNPPLTVYEFTEAVFVADGEDPSSADKKILNDVRMVVAAAFAKASGTHN